MFDKKSFEIVRSILKKHLLYLEKQNIIIEPQLINGSIDFKIKQKRKGSKINKERAVLAAKRLMLLLINLNDNI